MTLAYENRGWDSSVYSSGAKWTCRKLNACDSVAGLIVTVISKSNYKVRREYTAIMTTLSDVLTDLDISTEDVDCAIAEQADLTDWELLASLHDCACVFGDETAAYKLAMIDLRDRMDTLKGKCTAQLLTAIYNDQKAAFLAKNKGYTFSRDVVVLNGAALDETRPEDLERLIDALLQKRFVYLVCSNGPFSLTVNSEAREYLKSLKDHCRGKWSVWSCLGDFARFTDGRSASWLCNLDMERLPVSQSQTLEKVG